MDDMALLESIHRIGRIECSDPDCRACPEHRKDALALIAKYRAEARAELAKMIVEWPEANCTSPWMAESNAYYEIIDYCTAILADEPEQDDRKPEVKSIGGANTLDELIGLMEIARANKTGITLDWVEVGIILRAAEIERRTGEAEI